MCWLPPNWHADWGDPMAEFSQLKELSILLLSLAPAAAVTLEIPEPGYMCECL
jgi:hypothetical protein